MQQSIAPPNPKLPEDIRKPSVAADAATQQYGYVRCYRAVMKDCGVAAAALYGILEDYAQLSARNKQDCMPSHEKLGELLGVHRNTVVALMKKLKDAKWVEWDESSGVPNAYRLPTRNLHRNSATPAQNLCNPCTESVHYKEETLTSQELDVSKTSSSLAPSREPYTAAFEIFWKAYPKTNGAKLEAFKAWKLVPAEERDASLAGLAKWISSDHWHEGKIVFAERYLKRRMWRDEPLASANGHVRDVDPALMERLQREARALGAREEDAVEAPR